MLPDGPISGGEGEGREGWWLITGILSIYSQSGKVLEAFEHIPWQYTDIVTPEDPVEVLGNSKTFHERTRQGEEKDRPIDGQKFGLVLDTMKK